MSVKSTPLFYLTDLPMENYGRVFTYFEVVFIFGNICSISRICSQRRGENGQVLKKRWLISSHQMVKELSISYHTCIVAWFALCKSAVIAFIAAAVLHLHNPAKHKNGLAIFLSYKQKILLHKKSCYLNKIVPWRYKMSK